jgi:hypothetical protein
MIRPVVGAPLIVTSVEKPTYNIEKQMNIWPNPAKDFINIEQGELHLFESSFISIIDLNGRELIKVPYSQRIDISSLRDGMYILIISTNGIPVGYNRIMKIR